MCSGNSNKWHLDEEEGDGEGAAKKVLAGAVLPALPRLITVSRS